jgi:hypothetical protein
MIRVTGFMADIALAEDSDGYEDFVIERQLSTDQLMQFESEIKILIN